MDSREEMLDRLAASRRAGLATVDAGGHPHIVPIVFASKGDRIFTAVDHKPKKSNRLKRIANIHANPAVSLLADHYDEDWSLLWWVRVDGTARVVEDGDEFDEAIATLVAKYAQYRDRPPGGPVVVIDIGGVSGWSAGA